MPERRELIDRAELVNAVDGVPIVKKRIAGAYGEVFVGADTVGQMGMAVPD